MGTNLAVSFFHYERTKARVEEVVQKEKTRRSLIHSATLFKMMVTQQTLLESKKSSESHDTSSLKQDMNRMQHEKKLLENKVSLLSTEVDTWKKKSANQRTVEKENMTLKNQISKLNSQLQQSKSETNKITQKLVTQKAVLESKLDTAKKNIQTLKVKPTSPTKIPQSPTKTLMSPLKATPTMAAKRLGMKKPLVSNFSVSPFLSQRRPTSPDKPSKPSGLSKRPLSNIVSASTPVSNNVLAQSTPGTVPKRTPLKLNAHAATKPSGLKNVMSPDKSTGSNTATNSAKSNKKPSLFDDDGDEDDDGFFSNVKKAPRPTGTEKDCAVVEEVTITAAPAGDTTQVKANKKRKKKIGTKAIVEEEGEDELVKFSPLKRVKLMDALGGISPLKMRNKERGLFKV